jgi:hypothetical protein
MSISTTTTSAAPADRVSRRGGNRLGRRTRRAVLVLHIASAGAWLGLDVVMAVLVATSVVTDDVQTRAVAYGALGLVTVWPMTVAGLTCLLTGVVLGLGTTYGLFRYWWVVVKLVINVVLTCLVLFALRPGVDDVTERGRMLLDGQTVSNAIGDLAFPPIVAPTALLIAMVLSVYKPWGRIRRHVS